MLLINMSVRRFISPLLWLLFGLSLLVFSLGVSWQASKYSDFFYGFWYQTLTIEKVIVKNVVLNTQGKNDFPIHDIPLHQKMFSDIVLAIHNEGQGLASISYQNLQGNNKLLLTESEVIHLQDVANLLNKVSYIWWANLLIFLLLLDFYCRGFLTRKFVGGNIKNTIDIPSLRDKLACLAIFCIVLVASFTLWGFTDIFYYLHTVVFPDGHQWFFYYRDSLMSTLMKAPDIFAGIAVQLVIVAFVLATIVDACITKYRHHKNIG